MLTALGLLSVATMAMAVEGRVTDPQGRAREGCVVSAFVSAGSPSPEARPVASARTDRLGRFALPVETPGAHDITVRGCGAAATVPGVKPTADLVPIVVVVLDAGRVRGRVGDAAGQPVAGARLTARSSEPAGNLADVIGAETRPDGSFGMTAVPAGLVELKISHPAFLEATTRLVVEAGRESPRASLVLWRGGQVAGRVQRGEVQPDERQTLQVELSRQDPANPAPVQRKAVSLPGGFRFDRIPPGEAMLTLLDGENALRTTRVEVREGETTTVDLSARPTQVSGRVTRNGDALAGAEVRLLGRGTHSFSTSTSDDGSYELSVSEPGRYLARVTADTKVSLPARAVEVPETEWFGLDLDFETFVVEGLVLDADSGKAVGQAHVFASPKTPGAPFGETRADGERRFHLELLPGEHRLTVQASGYERQTLDLRLGTAARYGFACIAADDCTGWCWGPTGAARRACRCRPRAAIPPRRRSGSGGRSPAATAASPLRASVWGHAM